MGLSSWLTIGELAQRSGVATSALRFYEERGLIAAERTSGNQRRFPRAALRRVAVIRAGQQVGLTLEEIHSALAVVPIDRTPTGDDWRAMSDTWRIGLEARIASLEVLRDRLTGCIGCGCLSIGNCELLNPGDRVSSLGRGARYLLGDDPQDE